MYSALQQDETHKKCKKEDMYVGLTDDSHDSHKADSGPYSHTLNANVN